MLYMVIERFRDGDPIPVYRRFRERGRMAPKGVMYLGSWITTDLRSCYQLMDAPDLTSLNEWMAQWKDIVDFEVLPVMTSDEAKAAFEPRL
jgi:hypothetical protein